MLFKTWFQIRTLLLIQLLMIALPAFASTERLSLEDAQGNEFNVAQMVPDKPSGLLALWFVDRDDTPPRFNHMLESLVAAGIEVWRVDLLGDLFLPRSSEAVRTLPGDSIAALIQQALERHDGQVLLATYDRMALPLLRGLRLWQKQQGSSNDGDNKHNVRLLGAALFYPNPFGPAPPAGEAPRLDPIVSATNYPVIIFQPEHGSHRWRVAQIMQSLWHVGSPAYLYRVRGVRDWFFMGDPEHDNVLDAATAAAVRDMPTMLYRAATLLSFAPYPQQALPLTGSIEKTQASTIPKPLAQPRAAPTLQLPRYPDETVTTIDYRDQLTLVVFWATWCPPCVEEMPSLNALQKRFSDRALNIVSVDFQQDSETLRPFLERVPVAFPILLDHDGTAARDWQVFSFPSSFLVDANGVIRYSINRAIDWNTSEIHVLINSLLPAQHLEEPLDRLADRSLNG